jgi:colanic acid/amylovoran biosynthesis protein
LANITKLELIGQTVGPFYFWRKILARKLFNKSKLVVRDSLCADYLKKEINFKDFKISNDLAFLRLPFEDRRDYVIYKYKLKNNKYISIIPSGLYTCYSSSYEKYINNWLKIINTILKIDYLKDYELIFLGHVLKPGEYDDRKVIYKIKEKIDNSRCKFIFDELLPSEARTILGNGLLTLTGRMHPAISTFSKNKLAISLSYSIKYEGIIGRQLGLQETIIEKKNYWEDCIVDFKLKEALDDLAEKDKLKNFDISSKLDEVRRNIMEELFTD